MSYQCSCVRTHHLFDHKPDNLLRTAGNKLKLQGVFKFGTPGIAVVCYSNDTTTVDNFVDILKQNMPQKKFEVVFQKKICREVNGWEEAATATDLKKFLVETMNLDENDYYSVLGISNKGSQQEREQQSSKGKGMQKKKK